MAQYEYTLGAAGERTKVKELDRTVEYTYDELYRLTGEKITVADKTVTEYTYAYDKVINRILKTENGTKTAYTYNALNQLVKENDTVYKYDDAGNLISTTSSGKSAAYTYNAENKLIRATVQEGNDVSVEEYEYDYAGNRTVKKSENDYTYYLNDVSGSLTQVLAEIDSNGNEKCYYTRGIEIISQERNGTISYYLTDGHGSVRQLADSNGAVTDTYLYDAWGNLISSTGTTENSYLYCGEQLDSTTGLYYLRARYMNPTTGTFISMDTYQGSIFEPATLHKYLYANANPVMNVDPSGYMAQAVVLKIEASHDAWCMAVYRGLIATLVASVAVYESKVLSNLVIYISNSISKGLNWGIVNITFATEAIVRILANEFEDAIEELKRKIPNCTIIYRKGTGTYQNLTPRPEKDIEGLSYQLTVPLVFPFTFTAKELVDSTGILRATKDGPDHVSVYPRNMITMQQWIDSRDTANVNPHEYSVLLKSISVRVG